MGNVRRIYVEKKEPYAVKEKELHDELKNYLGIDVAKVRDEDIRKALKEKSCKELKED